MLSVLYHQAYFLKENLIRLFEKKSYFHRTNPLNLEERPLLHIQSRCLSLLGCVQLIMQMKQKCSNSIFIFFILNQNKLKMPYSYHHKWWQQLLQLHNQGCRLYFVLVLTRVVHCKINLQDSLGFTMFVIAVTLLLLHTVHRKILKTTRDGKIGLHTKILI